MRKFDYVQLSCAYQPHFFPERRESADARELTSSESGIVTGKQNPGTPKRTASDRAHAT
jgi:hypothetical protein